MQSLVTRLGFSSVLRSARQSFSRVIGVSAFAGLVALGGAVAFGQTSVPSSPLFDFGTVAVGSSVTQKITFTETSTGYHDHSVVTTQGVRNQDFQVTFTQSYEASGDLCQFPIAVGAQCTVSVTFAPKFPGDRYGAAQMMNQGGGVIGTAYLHGVGSGPQIAYGPGAPTPFSPSTYANAGFCNDSFGNVFVGKDNGDGTVSLVKIPADGISPVTTIASGFNYLASLGIDGAGNVYAVDINPQTKINRLLKFILQAGGGYAQNTLLSGDNTVVSVGSFYVDPAGSSLIYSYANPYTTYARLNLSGTTSTSTSIPGLPNSVVSFDAYGNAYSSVAGSTGTYRSALTGTSYAPAVQVSNTVNGFGVAADVNGNLFISDLINNRVVEYTLSNGVYTLAWTSSTLPNHPLGLVLDAAGNLYVDDSGPLYKFNSAGAPSLSFAATATGATSTDSPQTVLLQNIGNQPLNFAAPTTGNNPSVPTNFVYSASSTCPELTSGSTPFTLTPGAACTQIYSFVPTVAGAITGTVVNTDNNLNVTAATQSEFLVGTGLTQTTTYLNASKYQLSPTQPVTLTASVAPPINGYVVFSDNGTAISGSVNVSPGTAGYSTATYNVVSIALGNHFYTAAFTPANPALYQGSISSQLAIYVYKQLATITLTTPTILYTTATDTLTASIAYVGSTAPTGAVTLSVAGVGGVTNASPTCTGTSSPITCTYNFNSAGLRGGQYAVTLSLAGDANYAATSKTSTLVVSRQVPVFTAIPADSVYGSPETVSGTLSYPGTGAVPSTSGSFPAFSFDGGALLQAICTGTASPLTCTYTTAAALLSGGAHTVRFYYSGDANYSGNFYSPSASFTVSPQRLTIAASSSTITYGAAYVQLTSTTPFSGNVQPGYPAFSMDGGANLTPACNFSQTLQTCTYSYPSASLSAGTPHTYTATIAADNNYTAAPVSGTITVNPASESITFPQPASVTYAAGLTSTLAATSSSGLPIAYTVLSGPATVSGSTLSYTGPGVVTVQAAQAGNSNYNAATSVSTTVTVFAPQTITFPQPAAVSYGATTVLNASTSSGLAITYTVVSGPATLSGTTLTYTGIGTVVVSASQAGNSTYAAAAPASITFTVNPAAQSISFTGPASSVVYGVSPIALVATSSSGAAVTFSVVSGPGSISGTILTITGAGSVVVAASQAGSSNYSAAPQVTQTIVVTQTAQTIMFTAPASPVMFGSGTIALVATGGTSGNPIVFSVVSGPGTLSGSTLTLTGLGTITIAANQTGTANYSAATAVTRSVVVNPGGQVITFNAPASPLAYPAGAFTLVATSTTATPIVFSVVSGPASISGTTLTVTGAGTITIAASQAAIANYSAAAVSRVVVVNQGAQVITFTAPTSPLVYPASPVTLVATSTVANPIVFSVVSGPGTISGTTLTVTGSGTIVLAANQVATANYMAATPVTRTIVVSLAVQSATITFNAPGFPSFTLGAIKVVTLGATGQDFAFQPGGTCTVGATYAASNSCTVFYTFSPLAPGQRSGAIQFFDNNATPSLRASTPITGVSTGAVPAFFPAVSGTIAQSASSAPVAIAVDGVGSLYLGDGSTRSIAKMTLVAGTYVKTSIPSVIAPSWIQVDGNGSIYASGLNSAGQSEMVKETPTTSGSYIESVVPANNGTFTLGVDAAGNAYSYNGQVLAQITPLGRTVVIAQTGSLGNIAVSPAGVIYTSDSSIARNNGDAVVSYTLSNGSYVQAVVDASIRYPQVLGVDGVGNLYVLALDAIGNYEMVMELPTGGGRFHSVVIAGIAPLLYAYQVAVTGDGTVYSAQGDSIHTLRYTGEQATFSSTAVGTTSSDSPKTQTLWNFGNAPLNISALSVGTSNFAVAPSTAGSGCAVTASGATVAGTLAPASSCDLSLSFTPTAPGTLTDTLTLSGNGTPSTVTVSLSGTTALPSQTITFTVASPITVTNIPITLTGVSTSGLPVTYAVTGQATVSGNLLTLTGAGTVTITASQAGNASYAPATSVVVTLVVMQSTQTITLADPGHVSYIAGGGSYTLAPVGGTSGLPVTCAIASGPATISGYVVSYTAAGTVLITCNQAGNAQYASAPGKSVSLIVDKAAQTITVPTLPLTVIYGAAGPINVAAISSAGLPVTFSVIGAGSLNGNLLSVTGAGLIEIDYVQAGTTNYLAASASALITSSPPVPITTDLTSTPVGTPVPVSSTMAFTQAFTAGTISILSQGAPGTPGVITNAGTCSTGSSYAAGNTCTVTFNFTPTGPGIITTTVYIYDAAGNLQSAIPVTTIRYH